MKITRQTVADKIADYLHGKVSQAELVDSAERAMIDAHFDEADAELLSDIVGRLGLADVAEFGLRWQDCEEFIRRLGYRATVTVFETVKRACRPQGRRSVPARSACLPCEWGANAVGVQISTVVPVFPARRAGSAAESCQDLYPDPEIPSPCGRNPIVAFFSIAIVPLSGETSPRRSANNVDLPAPLGPTNPIRSPRLTWSETSSKSVRPAKDFES